MTSMFAPLVPITSALLLTALSSPGVASVSNEQIVEDLRIQTSADDARENLANIRGELEYRDIYPMLDAVLIENEEYPIPNELFDRVLEQFTTIVDGDMDAVADSFRRTDNENFDGLAASLTYLRHPEMSETGFFKVATGLMKFKDSASITMKQKVLAAIQDAPLYQSGSSLSDSFREDIFANITYFYLDDEGVLENELSKWFFQHIEQADDEMLKDLIGGFHKGNIQYSDYQQALEKIVVLEQCQKNCQGRAIQLLTYNDEIKLDDRDKLLDMIARRPNTSDYILGDLTMAAWDSRTPLTNPVELLETIKVMANYGPQAKLKMKQALRNMSKSDLLKFYCCDGNCTLTIDSDIEVSQSGAWSSVNCTE